MVIEVGAEVAIEADGPALRTHSAFWGRSPNPSFGLEVIGEYPGHVRGDRRFWGLESPEFIL